METPTLTLTLTLTLALTLDGEQATTPTTTTTTRRGRGSGAPPPLSMAECASFMDAAGRITNPPALRQRAFEGGVEAAARAVVWPLLLGVSCMESTAAERTALRDRKRAEYCTLRSQWQSISPAQEGNWSKWRERKARVDKDVVRTDRTQPYFAGPQHSPAAPTAVTATLRSILLSHVFYHWDLGYCQGMSDLLAPVLFVVRALGP